MWVKCLEKVGYIIGYGVYINFNKLGEFLMVFIEVMLSEYCCGDFLCFEMWIVKFDEIVECYFVSGGYDYLLKFVVCGVVYYQLIIEGMFESDYGIEKYFSYVVIKLFFIKYYFFIQNLFGGQMMCQIS